MKPPANERQGLQLSFKIDPGAPIPYVIGRTAVGGTVVHRETYGEDNRYETFFVALSLGRVAAIEQRLIDRASIPFFGTSATGYYNRWMWQDSQLGATPEGRALGHGVVNPPTGAVPSIVPGWGPAYRMSGYAATSLSLLFDTKAKRYQNGEPTPAWVIRGNLVWDPRLDSTYPGGSGACRRTDPSTWVYSDTPALHGLMWRLGIFHNGKKVMGVGAPIDLIDVASIVESANVQEANGWRVGGELNSGMDRWEALKLIEEAGGAEPISRGARMATLQKMPRVPVGTISAADIIEARSIPAMKPRRERINGFRARFRSEAHGWEIIPIDIVQVPDYVTADGGARTGSGDFSLVQNADQAGSLAAYKVFDSREIGPIELVLKPRFIGYRIGDCLTIDADETGLSGKQLIVRGRSIDPETGRVTMVFETEAPEKHAPALGQTGVVPPVPTLTFDPDIAPAPNVADWSVTGGTWQDSGYQEPAIFITGVVGNLNAENVVFEVRQAGTSEWTMPSMDPPDTTRKVILGVLSDTAYEVAISYKVRGAIGERRVYGPVTTGRYSIADLDEFKEQLDRIVSDGFLNRSEKPQAGIDWNALAGDLNALNARYVALGSPADLTAARDDANARFTALSNYLSSLSPPWFDATTDSPINAATYRQRWVEAHVAIATYRAAITGRKGDPGLPGAGAWTHISNNPEAGAVAEPTRAYTTGPRQDWGTYATQSIERFSDGCICSGTLPASHDDRVHVGLTTHPASGLSYQRLSFALSRESDGSMVTWVEGVQQTEIGTFTGQVDWSIEYDGTSIIWKVNGIVRDTFPWPNNIPLFFATALAGADPRVTNLAFAKAGAAGAPGADGFIVDTETPVFAIQCFSDGTPKPTWQGGVGTIRLVKGGQVVVADAYDLVSNQNMAGLSLSVNQFSFMGITADQGQFVARAFYGGQVYTRTISAKKVRDGEAAFKATSGYGQTGSFPNETVLTTASTPVPGGRGVTLSASASYGIDGNVPSQWVATMRIYWRNITDGGPWNLLDQQDGSIAIVENVGTPQEPRYERENGAVGCSGSFTMSAQDKQIGYEVRIQRRGGAGTVVLSGNAQLAVSS